MNKKERIQKAIAGEKTDRVPFSLWRHLPPEDATPEGMVRATVRFTRRWDLDFVKAMFNNWAFTIDWGNRFGDYHRSEGHVPVAERVIKDPSEWKNLRPLEPHRGALGNQVRAMRMLRQELGPDIPIVATVFAPLTVARNLAGDDVYRHALACGADVHAGLKAITETVCDFAQACVEAGADGIFLAVQGATHDALSPDAFQEFGLDYDLPVLERVASRTWFNILHLCKPNLRFEVARHYPVQAVNWHDRSATGPSLRAAREHFSGVLIGGLDHSPGGAFHSGVPEEAVSEARDAIAQTDGERFILGPGCVMHLGTPEANVDAVRAFVNP
jgi:uroporphyrinogen decarboxylase